MTRPRVLCYIVAYNAAPFIGGVLASIPESCWHSEHFDFDVLVCDDCSADGTIAVAERFAADTGLAVTVRKTRHNLGYGGNQKLGYCHAIRHGYDAVVLLHGDGQYDPAYIPDLVAPLLSGNADAVLGSRMLQRKDALKGGMPLYKFIGNTGLTAFQNLLLGTTLSEFHTGLRAYAVKTLARLPLKHNDDGYLFDAEILMQVMGAGGRIVEIPIRTHYGEETCHVNSVKYGLRVMKSTLAFRMHRLGFCYYPQYDYGEPYASKVGFDSSHRFALEQVGEARIVLDIGGSSGYVARALRERGVAVHGFDLRAPDEETARNYSHYTQLDLDEDFDFKSLGFTPDAVLLLDVLEHLREPEKLLYNLRDTLDEHTRIIITLPNVAFFTIRLKLLLGIFSYASRGIMDRTHLRFFTFASIKALLKRQGYAILRAKGIPAPFPLVIKSPRLAAAMLALNRTLIILSKGLFAFQIGLVVRPKRISHDS